MWFVNIHWKNEWLLYTFIRFLLNTIFVKKKMTGTAADFSDDLLFASLPRCTDTMVRKRHSYHFWASRWGGVEKMKKIAFSLGRCRKSCFWRSHAAWGSTKKNDSHAAWECENWDLRHLSSENAHSFNDWIFVVVDFCGFQVGTKLLRCGRG